MSDNDQDLKDLVNFFDNLSDDSKDSFRCRGNVRRWNSTVVNEPKKETPWHSGPIRVEPKIHGKWFGYSGRWQYKLESKL
jgi:hypothetical protein